MTEPNWDNRTLWTGDNLDIMRGMNSESVDLIYLDPPFNSNKTYSAPIGSKAAGAAFKDTWTLGDVDEAWHGEIADREPTLYAIIDAAGYSHGRSMKSYLIMMAVRLIEMKRLLKDTGSIYLHCDPTASHYLKALMDAVFGKDTFRNEVVWSYAKWSNSSNAFQRNHDTILFYAKKHHKLNIQRQISDDKKKKIAIGYQVNKPSGIKQLIVYDWIKASGKIKSGDYDRVIFKTEMEGTPMSDSWSDINILNSQSKERVGYPTQKPLALLDRIIKASSNEGETIMDPFCGCATACVAAEQRQRNWVGIDLSPLAAKLVNSRLQKDMGLFFDIHHREDVPKRSDLGDLPSYRTHKHMLYGRQEGVCGGCQVMFPFRNMTVDHIVAQSRGGSDHIDNLQLLCGACNSTKGTGSQEEFIVRLTELGMR